MKVLFSEGAVIKRRMVQNILAGAAEEIKIEAQDPLEHWILFQHDGRGQIVHLEMGNHLSPNPCRLR